MIYMDNSATSYPKPQSVRDAVVKSFDTAFANPGRSSHSAAYSTAAELYRARECVAEFVNTVPENVVFTYNATYALNMAIHGVVKKGMHIATTLFEHNSVLRPLYASEREKEVTLHFLNCDTQDKSVLTSDFERMLKSPEKPSVLVMTHTSNVTGGKMPVEKMGRLCRENGVIFILDASQGLGAARVDMEKMGVGILCTSGHKGLFGITGSGFMAISKEFNKRIAPIISGGSGIMSHEREMPSFLPERLEAGTVGMAGIVSVRAGIDYINGVTSEYIAKKTSALRKRLIEGISTVKGIRLYAPETDSVSVVLFNLSPFPSETVARLLDEEGVCVRAGFHCAPLAHDFLDTGGAVRLSLSVFNTEEECDRVLLALEKISRL